MALVPTTQLQRSQPRLASPSSSPEGAASGNKKLHYIFRRVWNGNTPKSFDRHQISDLWLPLSRQTLRRLIANTAEEILFLQYQNDLINGAMQLDDGSVPDLPQNTDHASIEDDEDIVTESRVLGEGAYGVVDEVIIGKRPDTLVCVRKRIERPRNLRAQARVMEAFAREINVMRQVSHPHCVRFLGSYTDMGYVNILLSPVADMDLARFLDEPLTLESKRILYRGIGCLCNAIHYLHKNKIRHEDLKPSNILIHGGNLLLTDFGFSLDFSDDSISTTTGRPSAWTIRYSAPEVLNFQPRNRASDIFSLGCVLVEMISGILGFSLTQVKAHWRNVGNGQSSFAQNPRAGAALIRSLKAATQGKLQNLCEYVTLLLDANRVHRPSAGQVVDRLLDLSVVFPADDNDEASICFTSKKCHGLTRTTEEHGIALASMFKLIIEAQFDQGPLFYPWQYPDWTYELWDFDVNFLYSHTPKEDVVDTENPASDVEEPTHFRKDMIYKTLKLLYLEALHMDSSGRFWQEFTSEEFSDRPVPQHKREHALLSARMFSLKHALFIRKSLPHRSSNTTEGSTRNGQVQITLLPICLPRSPFYGNGFFMISYHRSLTQRSNLDSVPPEVMNFDSKLGT